MRTLDQAIKLLNEGEAKLVPVRRLMDLPPAGDEIDSELHKLGYNIKIFSKLALISGQEVIKLESEYKRMTLEHANSLVGENLSKVGLVRSNKFKYIQMLLHREEEQMEMMRAKYKYFRQMYDTYVEWINILKKTRSEGGVH